MSKKELLEAIEAKELAKANAMSREELIKYVYEYYSETLESPLEEMTTHDIIYNYIVNFMSWTELNDVEELSEVLKGYGITEIKDSTLEYTVRCNNCWGHYTEEELLPIDDMRACPKCKTDAYLIDLNPNA